MHVTSESTPEALSNEWSYRYVSKIFRGVEKIQIDATIVHEEL
jgi:hypothetical protein